MALAHGCASERLKGRGYHTFLAKIGVKAKYALYLSLLSSFKPYCIFFCIKYGFTTQIHICSIYDIYIYTKYKMCFISDSHCCLSRMTSRDGSRIQLLEVMAMKLYVGKPSDSRSKRV